LTILNGLFAGAELAILSLRKTRIKELQEEGHNSAKAIMALREHPERFLATVQIGITVISATAGAFGGATLALRLTPLLEVIGLGSYAPSLSFALIIVFVSYLSLILGELVPKSLALKYTESYAMFISRPLLWLSVLARPLVWILTGSSNLLLGIFQDKTTFSESRLSPEELRQLVEEASRSGTLDPHAGEIACRAFDFGQLTAGQIALPRAKVDAISINATIDELRKITTEKTHNRYPVYQENLDDIIGYVTMKDLLKVLFSEGKDSLRSIVREAYFTPTTALATQVLRELQRRHTLLAIVLDEHGGLSGLLTAENLLEELVGNVANEYEVKDIPFQKQPDGSFLIKGSAPIHTLNRELHLDLEEGKGHTTISGLVVWMAESMPSVGAVFTTQDGSKIEVVETDPKRVKLVRLWPSVKESE
jgi:putative hemolysin